MKSTPRMKKAAGPPLRPAPRHQTPMSLRKALNLRLGGFVLRLDIHRCRGLSLSLSGLGRMSHISYFRGTFQTENKPTKPETELNPPQTESTCAAASDQKEEELVDETKPPYEIDTKDQWTWSHVPH
jgi:hypothetical protein